MSEVTSLLRSMRLDGGDPQIRMICMKRVNQEDPKTTLLDGGATHCLRPAKSRQEWETSMECEVSLTSGRIWMRQNKITGTLLTLNKETQRIVPIRELMRLGIRIQWEEGIIRMTRPDGQKIPVWLDGGCPVVDDAVGRQLMQEVEDNNTRTAGIMKVFLNKDREEGAALCGDEAANYATELKSLFPKALPRLVARVPGAADLDMSQVPFNRRTRKKINEATTRVLHIFSGEKTSIWTKMNSDSLIIVCVELEKGLNLLDNQLFGYLEQCARDGIWDMILGGPPCRSVSLSRHRGDGGPRPLRSRTGDGRWGLSWNTFAQQEKVDGDSLLWLRMLWIMCLAKIGNPKCEFLVEQPADPETWLPASRERPYHGFPSFLSWEETETICKILGLKRIHLDQGAFGHPRVKPTTLLTDIKEIQELQGTRCEGRMSEWPESLEDRLEASKEAAAWASGLVDIIQTAIMRKKSQAVFGPRQGTIRRHPERCEAFLRNREEARRRLGLPPLPEESMALKAIDARSLEEWKQHVANEHIPARRDCSHCLRNMGRDRPHVRQLHPEAFCMNVDIAGPFKGGHDQLETAPRYFMVGVFTVPMKDGCPLAQKLQEMGGSVESPQDIQAQQELEKQLLSQNGKGEAGESEVQGADQGVDLGEGPSEREEALPEAVVRELDLANQRWKEAITEWTDVKIQNLTMSFPLKSRHVSDVMNVMSTMYCRLRSLGLPLHRVHTDRAREFTSRALAAWFRQRDIAHTTSAGDESQGCARAEQEIGYLKNRTRLLLGSAGAEAALWPLALRHAAEQRFRAQMALMGVRLPQLVPFGTQAMARIKRWHHVRDRDGWEHPMQQVTVYGPAHAMSPTSHGYYILCQGRWMITTVVVRYFNPPPAVPVGSAVCDNVADSPGDYEASIAPAEEQAVFDVSETEEGKESLDLFVFQELPQASRAPPRRLHGKQTVPGLCAFRPGGEWTWDPMNIQDALRDGGGLQHQDALRDGGGLQDQDALRDGGGLQDQDALRDGGGLQDQDALCDGGGLRDQGALRDGGGLCDQVDLRDDRGVGDACTTSLEDWEKAWKRVLPTVQEGFRVMALELLQLRELRKLEQEEKVLLDEIGGSEIPCQVHRECEHIETKLKALQNVEEEWCQPEQSTLVTRSVPLEEVRRNLEDWTPALEAEYKPLIEHQAIQPLNEQQYQKIKSNTQTVELIPGMVVATLKPPSKKKTRVVACGNHIQSGAERGDLSAGGIDTIAFRSMISVASRENFEVGTADVRTAFLQAPRRQSEGRETIVQPPSVLKEAGCLQHGWSEKWRSKLRDLRWTSSDSRKMKLIHTAESHLWKLVEAKDGCDLKGERALGYLGVYVDDLVITAKQGMLQEFMNQLGKVFLMAPFDVVTEEKSVTFCGYEIRKQCGGFTLHQEKYVGDLLERRGVKGYEVQPLPKIEEGEDETEKDGAVIKEVQAVVGELQWLATRTRPDLAYSTSLVARMVHRRPNYALKLCSYILRYLNKYPSLGLVYGRDEESGTLHVKADTSFGPAHEQFRSVQGVALYHGSHLLLWTSSRQPFVTLSTAESELVGYSEALQCGMSLSELLSLLNYPTKKILEGDSKAALCQVTSDAGSWRTRHLRLRAWKLREVMMGGDSQWASRHVPGGELVADGLSKPLQGAAHRKFLSLLGLQGRENEEFIEKKENIPKVALVQRAEQVAVDLATGAMEQMTPALLGAGLALCSTKQHSEVGVMLIVTSMVVKWWERRKNSQDPQGIKNSQDPLGIKKSQDPLRQQEPNGPCRMNRVEQEPLGPQEHKKKDEDPNGTRKSRSNPQTPNGRWDLWENLPRCRGPKSSEDLGLGGRAPGLRAMRIEPKEGKGSGSSAAMDHGSRGVGPMTGKGGARQRGAIAVSGLRAEPSANGGEDGSTTSRTGGYGSSTSGTAGATSVEIQVDQLTEDIQLQLHLRGARSSANVGRAAGHPSREGEVNDVSDRRGVVTRQDNVEKEKELASDEPWKLEWFSWPPQGKSDRWDDSLWSQHGWIVRAHGKERIQPFHPIHRSTPIQVESLHEERVTVVFNEDGKEVLLDHWKQAKRFPFRSCWKGYTFFRRSSKGSMGTILERQFHGLDADRGDGGARPSTSMAAATSEAEELSDGSFIQVND